MSKIKKIWIEIIFSALLALTVLVSLKGDLRSNPQGYRKQLVKNNVEVPYANLETYLRTVSKMTNSMVVITVKGDQGRYVSRDAIEELKSMGFTEYGTLRENISHSFIGIWNKGKVVYEQVGGDESISYGQYINNHYIYAQSATEDTGNLGNIYIDSVQYSVAGPGLNIVTIDLDDAKLIDSINFNTTEKDNPVERLPNKR